MSSQTEIRESITSRIVEALRQGTIPWRKPWSNVADPVRLPTNYVTKQPYHGMNVMLLWLTAQERAYPANFWASYQQWRSIGAQVRKGEKSTQVVFWRPIKKKVKDEHGVEREESFPLLRTWSVFNVAQVEGKAVEQFQVASATAPHFTDIDRSEFDRAVAATNADIRYGFNQAAYRRPPADFITMPNEDRFHSFPDYAETLLHELAHWSELRTNWSGSYAEGELRAEIAACFMASSLGIPNSDDLTNHTAYIGSWLQALQNDPKFIFRASSAASKAADYVLGFSSPKEQHGDEAEEFAQAA